MGHKPDAPTYNTNKALAEQNRLNHAAGYQTYANINSPLGGYTVDVDPETGRMTVNKNLSENSLLAQGAQANALSRFVADPYAATQAYYNSQMAYVQPQFDAQIDAAKADMANRGIKMGSKTWNDTLASIENAQDKAKTAMLNDAMFNAQNYQTNLINQAQAAGNMVIDPALIEGARGAGLENTYNNKWQNEQDIYKTQMARYNARMKAIFGSVGSVGGSVAGGLASGGGGGTTYDGAVTNDGMYGSWAGK